MTRSVPRRMRTGGSLTAPLERTSATSCRLARTTRDERGFTLGELMVVVLILSVLMAIAVPYHFHQRRKGWNVQVIGALRNMATIQESWRYDILSDSYATQLEDLQAEGFNFSERDVAPAIVAGTPELYCLEAHSVHDPSIVWHTDSRVGRPAPGPAPEFCYQLGAFGAGGSEDDDGSGDDTGGSSTTSGGDSDGDGIPDDQDPDDDNNGVPDGSVPGPGGGAPGDVDGDGVLDDDDDDDDGDGYPDSEDPDDDGDGVHDDQDDDPGGVDPGDDGDGKGGNGKGGGGECKQDNGSDSDPDSDDNGGADKPGSPGGVDQEDKDCNNGSGNDADGEDDNNGGGDG